MQGLEKDIVEMLIKVFLDGPSAIVFGNACKRFKTIMMISVPSYIRCQMMDKSLGSKNNFMSLMEKCRSDRET
jgi:hypothetical protein